jgi:ABC-type phosphate transport system substrate-binding protein
MPGPGVAKQFALGTAMVATVLTLLAGAPAGARAEFAEALRTPCTGTAIEGEGSTAQKIVQQEVWIPQTFKAYCERQGQTAPGVTYAPDGSSCGLGAFGAGGQNADCTYNEAEQEAAGARNAKTRFVASDAPPTEEQRTKMEAAGGPNPGKLHVLPVASFAVTVVVHFPEGCELEDPEQVDGNGDTTTGGHNDPSGKGTGDTFSEGTLRVHIPAAVLERIWRGRLTTWGEVVETIGGKIHMRDEGADQPTAPLEQDEGFHHCKEVPVRRIVRFDGSGTTYNFKAYLSLLPGAQTTKNIWTEAPIVGTNTNWPLTETKIAAPPAVEANGVCTHAISEDHICRASGSGNEFVARAVRATDGSIGYVDLATADDEGFAMVANPNAETEPSRDQSYYWVPLETINPKEVEEGKEGVGTNYVEPSLNPKLNLASETREPGTNCEAADYRGYPETGADPTLGEWSRTYATGSLNEVTYPACGLTYDFAWDDDATVYGSGQAEERQARTVKDYLTAVTSVEGQQEILNKDYGDLSETLQEIARHGVAAIGWDKEGKPAGGGGGGEKGPEEHHTTTTVSTSTSAQTSTLPPSNAFTVASAKVKGSDIVIALVLPASGEIAIRATSGSLTVSSVTAGVGGGQGTVNLPISAAASKKVAKSKSGKLKVTIAITYTPSGGTAAEKTITLTLTKASLKPKHARRKKR